MPVFDLSQINFSENLLCSLIYPKNYPLQCDMKKHPSRADLLICRFHLVWFYLVCSKKGSCFLIVNDIHITFNFASHHHQSPSNRLRNSSVLFGNDEMNWRNFWRRWSSNFLFFWTVEVDIFGWKINICPRVGQKQSLSRVICDIYSKEQFSADHKITHTPYWKEIINFGGIAYILGSKFKKK